nr:hypothetical protein [Acidiphilium cryptum]
MQAGAPPAADFGMQPRQARFHLVPAPRPLLAAGEGTTKAAQFGQCCPQGADRIDFGTVRSDNGGFQAEIEAHRPHRHQPWGVCRGWHFVGQVDEPAPVFPGERNCLAVFPWRKIAVALKPERPAQRLALIQAAVPHLEIDR